MLGIIPENKSEKVIFLIFEISFNIMVTDIFKNLI